MIKPLTLVAAMLATQAQALSCLPPNVAADYHRANEAEEIYVVVHGTLRFDETLLPKRSHSHQTQRQEVVIPAWLDGKSLGPAGFTQPFRTQIGVRVFCLGPWCGGAVSGDPYLAFLKRVDGGYEMSAGPCPSMTYARPSQEQLDQAARCFRGGRCPRPF